MVQQSSTRSTMISLAAHAAAIATLLWLVPKSAVPPDAAPLAAAIEIGLVDPPPPAPPPAPPPSVPAVGGDNTPAASAKLRPLGLHGTAAANSIVRAPRQADPYADLAISYDTDASPEANGPGAPDGSEDGGGVGGVGHGLGLGIGAGGDGDHGFDLPPIPQVSMAKSPQPKYDYSEGWIPGSRHYPGKELLIDLRVNKQGRVHGAHVVEGIEPHLDRRAIAIALHFEFDPALDKNGEPVEGTYRWRFRIRVAWH
jgi:hypothetical protein